MAPAFTRARTHPKRAPPAVEALGNSAAPKVGRRLKAVSFRILGREQRSSDPTRGYWCSSRPTASSSVAGVAGHAGGAEAAERRPRGWPSTAGFHQFGPWLRRGSGGRLCPVAEALVARIGAHIVAPPHHQERPRRRRRPRDRNDCGAAASGSERIGLERRSSSSFASAKSPLVATLACSEKQGRSFHWLRRNRPASSSTLADAWQRYGAPFGGGWPTVRDSCATTEIGVRLDRRPRTLSAALGNECGNPTHDRGTEFRRSFRQSLLGVTQLEAESWRATVTRACCRSMRATARACERVANVSTTMMTAEPMVARGVHYTALVDTIDHQGATKLDAREREQLLEAADVLLFGEPDSEWTVRSAEVLIEALETSERWSVESCDQLREHLSGCGAPTGAS